MGNTQSKLLEPYTDEIMETTMKKTYIPMPTKTVVYNFKSEAEEDDVRDSSPDEWKKYVISKNAYTVSVDGIHEFEVYCLVVKNGEESKTYMKPVTKVQTYEFEEMFDFGIGCDRYDENKVIQVLYPKDYSQRVK